VQVAECFENESIGATLQKASCLAAEESDGFFPCRWSPWLQPNSQGTNGADHKRSSRRSIPGQHCGGSIDALGFLIQSVARELHRVRAESVRLQNLGTRLDVGLVHLLHQARLADTQLVVAGADEYAAGIQHGTHGSIEHVNPA